MTKAAIITFLSLKSKDGKQVNYRVDGSEQIITGVETNDAPVKYLLDKSVKEGKKVDRIACIVSEEVYAQGKPDSAYNLFQKMVKEYVDYDIEFVLIPYDFCNLDGLKIEKIATQQEKVLSVYRGIANSLENYDEVYIDYTGGFRDTSFLTTVLIRYLEFINVTCKDIVYSNKFEEKLYSLSYIYDMFKLLNAVSQFVETGSGKLLHSVYDSVEHEPTKNLVKCIQKFSKVIHLCNVKEVEDVIEELTQAIQILEKEYVRMEKQDVRVDMFRELLHVIKKKFYLEGEDVQFTYPKLIKWCIDNNLIQQALTLYVEKMPIVYCREGIVKKLPCKEGKLKGTSPEVQSFYTSIYRDILEKEDRVCAFKEVIDRIKEKYESEANLSQNIKEVMEACQEEQLKVALRRMQKFLNGHYYGCDYECKNQGKVDWTVSGIQIKATTGIKFVNELKNREDLAYAFIWKDEKKVKEYKTRGTNKKKVVALQVLEKLEDISVYTDWLSKEELRNIMIYYLAIKYLRNHINHAAEGESEEDELILEKYFEEKKIEVEMELENVRKILLDGLYLTNPELF